MRPSFHPRLINDPFSDPGLFIPFLFEPRALLFDLGDLKALSSRDLLKIEHVFVTHTHMDHFIGFDGLLRIFLGREKELHIYGPPGFFSHVEGRLAGYAWNLVQEYENNFVLKVTEIHEDRKLTKTYPCKEGFRPTSDAMTEETLSGVVLKEPAFYVEAVLLNHRLPCLGLSLVENFYINIVKEGLKRLGLEIGPWINLFKKAIYDKRDMSESFPISWKEKDGPVRERTFILGELAKEIALISPGQKITYITDVINNFDNRSKIVNLARAADHLFIEAAFMDRDREIAIKKHHLTSREAGEIAGEAGVKRFTLFHFSPRYSNHPEEIHIEALEAFRSK